MNHLNSIHPMSSMTPMTPMTTKAPTDATGTLSGKESFASLTQMPAADAHFPFGTYAIAEDDPLHTRYAEAVPDLANGYPLPPVLPRRHPLLEHLSGVLPVQDELPPWWPACVEVLAATHEDVRPLLLSMSREEFRRGSLDYLRWKAWRDDHYRRCAEREDEARPIQLWKGSGLSWLIDAVLSGDERDFWMDRWVNRGSRAMPADLDLVLTADPAWWLNMSNGYGWYTCMGSGIDRDPRILGNWYDTGVLLAALVARGETCWTPGSLIARTTLRVVSTHFPQSSAEARSSQSLSSPPCIVIGRTYHNDQTAACHLLNHLAAHLEAQGVSWGCISGTGTFSLLRSGAVGAITVEACAQRMAGPAFWRPEEIDLPYLDGDAFFRTLFPQEAAGDWSYPGIAVHGCHRGMQDPRSHAGSAVQAAVQTQEVVR